MVQIALLAATTKVSFCHPWIIKRSSRQYDFLLEAIFEIYFLASSSLLQADALPICGEVIKCSYNSFTDKERFLIGKYPSVYRPTKAIRKFKKTHSHLTFGECTVRTFHAKYEPVLKDLPEPSMDVVLSKKKAGRPLLLDDEIDKKVQEYLHTLRKKGGIVNSIVVITTSKALIEQSNDEHLKCILI